MEPLGTPQLLCFACDKWLFTLHFWLRLLKYNSIHFKEFPLISQSLRNRLNVIVDVVKRLSVKSLNITPFNKPLLKFTDQLIVASRRSLKFWGQRRVFLLCHLIMCGSKFHHFNTLKNIKNSRLSEWWMSQHVINKHNITVKVLCTVLTQSFWIKLNPYLFKNLTRSLRWLVRIVIRQHLVRI